MTKNHSSMNVLLKKKKEPQKKLFYIGNLVEGTIIEMGRAGIFLDLQGLAIGVIRGPELYDESGESLNLKIGDKITATVIELENERGEVELSLRVAGHLKVWEKLKEIMKNKEIIKVKVTEANKGGLLIQYGKISGFLPASQLAPHHYPKVEMGDKNKILEELKKLINQSLNVAVITAEEVERKLIVSERLANQEKQKDVLAQYKVGDIVEGIVTGMTNFGVFLEFGEKEKIKGLIHISELAWQRIEKVEEIVKIGDQIKVMVVEIENSKISLSLKRMFPNPWQEVGKKYKVGQIVSGQISKITPYGLFIELDDKIHGLVHISELPKDFLKNIPPEIKGGKILKFKIISLEPDDYRLGLSLKT